MLSSELGKLECLRKLGFRVPALQPLAKSDLQDHIGLLTPELLETLQARVLQYIGLV